ncbi:hypothetical protein Tanf_02615 [Tannerella forsythia]|nr:hypothetical protein Tanf_02615 [Tannerella forsythia]OLQ21667.1 hypothetical protein BGK60_12565 [Tannerella forsythia]
MAGKSRQKRAYAQKKKVKVSSRKLLPSLVNAFKRIVYQNFGYSSDTVSLFRPLARREANTRRPLAVDILRRNPCLFFLLRFEG